MAHEHIPIRLLLAVILFYMLTVAYVSSANVKANGKLTKPGGAGGKEVILNGFTAESTHLPMQLKCDASDTGILVGSITIDKKQVNSALLESVKNECEKTTYVLKTGPPSERLRCELVLAGATSLTGKEHIRVVYQCYSDSPSGWEEETVKTASQKKAGKFATMQSSKIAIFKVISVKIDGIEADTSKFPELGSGAIERECFRQNIKQAKGNSNGKVKYVCSIENKANYGGALEISYRCDNPPTNDH